MLRLPLSRRALLLVPLLAAAADQARATLVCGGSGQTCFETAGSGSLGAVGLIVLIAYALGLAAIALVRSLRPSAPRLRPAPILLRAIAAPPAGHSAAPLATAAAGRAPPLTLT